MQNTCHVDVGAQLGAVLESWQLGQVQTAQRTTSGTMNETFILTAGQRRMVLRRHRVRERWRVEHEHAVIAEARCKGVPTPASVRTPRGAFVVEHEGVLYSLFEFARGCQLDRNQLTPGRTRSMGQTLASIHVALADFPVAGQTAPEPTSDLGHVTATIHSLVRQIDERSALTEQDTWARDHLRSKARWLQTAPAMAWQPTPADAVQVGHGDYQETNLFFVDDHVVDVIDWDKAEPCWPVAEIVRCLDLSLRLQPDLCDALVRGYRSVHEVSLDDLDLAAANYGYHRVHSHWLYEQIYEQGNDRLRQFLKPGPFVPFADRWAVLRPTLR